MLLSPTPSTTSSATGTTGAHVTLPLTRRHPLKPGSPKEIALIDYIDGKVLYISRRYAKKFSDEHKNDPIPGYEEFGQLIQDLDIVFDVVWISGTPSLQVPYLLQLAGLLSSDMPSFPFSPGPTFRMLKKFDLAFSQLLTTPSPTNGNSKNESQQVSATDCVRIKSLVEATRIAATEVATQSGIMKTVDLSTEDSSDDDDEDEDTQVESDEDDFDGNPNKTAVGLGKIYERTLTILGDVLGDDLLPESSALPDVKEMATND